MCGAITAIPAFPIDDQVHKIGLEILWQMDGRQAGIVQAHDPPAVLTDKVDLSFRGMQSFAATFIFLKTPVQILGDAAGRWYF